MKKVRKKKEITRTQKNVVGWKRKRENGKWTRWGMGNNGDNYNSIKLMGMSFKLVGINTTSHKSPQQTLKTLK